MLRAAGPAMLHDVPRYAHRGRDQSDGAGHVDGIEDEHNGQDNKRPAI